MMPEPDTEPDTEPITEPETDTDTEPEPETEPETETDTDTETEPDTEPEMDTEPDTETGKSLIFAYQTDRRMLSFSNFGENMIPLMEYGQGWIVHIDFSAVETVWNPLQIAQCWAELCKYNDLISQNGKLVVFQFRTKPPENLYPGYYSRVQLLLTGDWMVNALGTTPVNAAEWSDPWHSPYYTTPTCYVKVLNLDPVYVAHLIIHELFHLMMPFGQHWHSPIVGTVFESPIGSGATVTVEAGKRLADSIWHLGKGYRVMFNNLVIIPHLLGVGMLPPGPFPGLEPPRTGPITRIDGKILDFANSRLKFD